MARTKPGPAPKREPLIPRTLTSLNLSKDILIIDRSRLESSPLGPSLPTAGLKSSGRITTLGGDPKVHRRNAQDLAPQWGTIDPASENSDDIVQLFDEWRLHLEGLTSGTIRVKKFVRKSYPREYKLKALALYRLGVTMKRRKPGSLVLPEWERISLNQAAVLLHVNRHSIQEWEKAEDKIIQSLKGSRQVTRATQAHWPEMEVELHNQFKATRKCGQSINRNWFHRKGKKIFADLYPNQVGFNQDNQVVFDCLFSNGWFLGFKRWWNISWRCKTNIASKTPEDYRPKIIMFCKFNQRNSQLRVGEEQCDVGRFPLGNMFNMDQTPFPFEFLTGRTYDIKGNKTIWERALRASWTKRQATLQITISADARKRCMQLLIFRGTGETKAIMLEKLQYDSRVRTLFNTKGYSNEKVTLNWLKTDLLPACAFPNKPRFIALDVFAGQKTASVLYAFRESQTVTSFIPEGCTSLVQPLDTAVNKTLKLKISELLDQEIDKNPDLWETGKFTVGDKRVLMTWVVGEAWDWLHEEKKKLIFNSFCHVGISLAIDGSEDTKLQIKGLEGLEIGDWTEGGLDCNLDRLGKTGVGELQWDVAKTELLDPVVATEAEKELSKLSNEDDDGKYVDIDDISQDMEMM